MCARLFVQIHQIERCLPVSAHVILNEAIELSIDERWTHDCCGGEFVTDCHLTKSLATKEVRLLHVVALARIHSRAKGGHVDETLDAHLATDLGQTASAVLMHFVVIVVFGRNSRANKVDHNVGVSDNLSNARFVLEFERKEQYLAVFTRNFVFFHVVRILPVWNYDLGSLLRESVDHRKTHESRGSEHSDNIAGE